MQKNRAVAALATAFVVAFAASFVLMACGSAQPMLSATVSDGARDVPLTTDLKVRAQGAILQQAVLERIDPPGERLELSVSEDEARLTGNLDPDASYRLVATAQAQEPTPLPWQERALTKLSLERVFSTVRAPAMVGGASPMIALPGQPLEFRFSEPIARAEVQAPGIAADAKIMRNDPRLLRVQLKDPRPGQDLTLRLVDVVGVNGAPAEEYRVSVHTPDAVGLVSVADATAPGRIQVATDRPLMIQWSRPVASFTYTVDDAEKTWSGEPNSTIQLPVHSAPGRSINVTFKEAAAEDGGWLTAAHSYELVAPAPLKIAATWPETGATNISLTGDPTIRFSEPIGLADQAAAEAAIVFDPPVAGRFQWLAQDRVRFLPEEGFPRLTDMTLTVNGGAEGVRAQSGGLLEESFSLVFQTGKKKVIDISIGRQVLTLLEDDEPVFTALVGTGVRGADTPLGTYQVHGKVPRARFRGVNVNGSRYDIPNVNWVLPFWGDYAIHGAHWRGNFGVQASNGCVSLTDANAKVVYDWADEGTTVFIHR